MMRSDSLQTSRAFDQVAEDYDVTYGSGGNAAMIWMRAENLAFLKRTFPPESHLVELGCGTGEEAVALAREGRCVIATDISPRMAAVTRRKAIEAGLGSRVQPLALPASNVGALKLQQDLDGAYASFGALNCEPDLRAVGRGLARLVKPGGLFVTSVMGRACLFEMLWYILRARPRRAFRRISGAWGMAPVAGEKGREVTVPTRYLSARQMAYAMGPAWKVEAVWALPLLMPPPYAASLLDRYPRIFDKLEAWDRRLRRRGPWRHFGDHLVLVFRRRVSVED
jgi:SAM-dependent methyltransferase